MSRFRIEFGTLAPKGLDHHQPDIAAIRQAMRSKMLVAAQLVKAVWIRRAQGLNISRTGAYIRGIAEEGEVRLISEHTGATSVEITWAIVNTAPHARIVEDGHAAFSMVNAINWGNSKGKVKYGKNGPYLHIPFGHSAYQSAPARERSGMTRGTLRAMMPSHIYKSAKKLEHTRPMRQGPIYKGGRFVQSDRYKYGGRLHHKASAGIQVGPGVGAQNSSFEARRTARQVGKGADGKPLTNPAWQGSKFHGMIRSGAPGHSKYTTIRTITPNSLGWNIPAQMGYGIARQVASSARSGVLRRKMKALVGAAAKGAGT